MGNQSRFSVNHQHLVPQDTGDARLLHGSIHVALMSSAVQPIAVQAAPVDLMHPANCALLSALHASFLNARGGF